MKNMARLVNKRLCTQRLILSRWELKSSDFEFFKKVIADEKIREEFPEFPKLPSTSENKLTTFFKRTLRKRPQDYFVFNILRKQSSSDVHLVIRLNDEFSTPIGFFHIITTNGLDWDVEFALLEQYRKKGYISEVLRYIFSSNYKFLGCFNPNRSYIRTIGFRVNENENSDAFKLIKVYLKDHSYNIISKDFFRIFI